MKAVLFSCVCGMHMLVVVALPAQQRGVVPQDSSFLLTTMDPRRAPSPYIGNGRIGVVIPAMGIGAAPSYKAGLYEEGPGDVPRIVVMPAWNSVGVFDGETWLPATPDSSVRSYRQTIDMRAGTARTTYDWTRNTRRIGVAVETFVSRADAHLAVIRLDVTPQQPGRVRVRFGLTGWPPPRRLALASLPKAQPSWKPADIWYAGHMEVRSRAA